MSHPLQTFKQWSPTLGKKVYIADSARVIGDVSLGDDCSVWPMAVIRGDVHTIKIGHSTSIQDNAVLHCTHRSTYKPEGYSLSIGNNVTVGHNASLHGCTIGNNVLIGIHATVLDGAIIEDNVIVGAGSLVPPHAKLETGYLYIGSPAKASRKLSPQEIEYNEYSSNNYIKLKNDYLDH